MRAKYSHLSHLKHIRGIFGLGYLTHGKKVPLEKFVRLYFGLKHPKMTMSSSQCARLLLKKCPLFTELPFYFPKVPLYFSKMPFCFPELPFSFAKFEHFLHLLSEHNTVMSSSLKKSYIKEYRAYGTKSIWNTEAKSSQIYKFKYAQVTKQLNHLDHIKWHRRCKSDFLVDKCK